MLRDDHLPARSRLVELQTAILDVLDCERVTLFVVDECTKEVHSQSSLDVCTPVIRVSFNMGIAGWVAEMGQALNISDAYESPLLNRDIDRATGFCTCNILCHPIRDTSGARDTGAQAPRRTLPEPGGRRTWRS